MTERLSAEEMEEALEVAREHEGNRPSYRPLPTLARALLQRDEELRVETLALGIATDDKRDLQAQVDEAWKAEGEARACVARLEARVKEVEGERDEAIETREAALNDRARLLQRREEDRDTLAGLRLACQQNRADRAVAEARVSELMAAKRTAGEQQREAWSRLAGAHFEKERRFTKNTTGKVCARCGRHFPCAERQQAEVQIGLLDHVAALDERVTPREVMASLDAVAQLVGPDLLAVTSADLAAIRDGSDLFEDSSPDPCAEKAVAEQEEK